MKKIIITALSSAFLFSSINIAYTATKLNEKDKEFFYETLFREPDTDMFIDNSSGITVNGKKLGQFKSSSKGITVYLSLYQAFKNFSKIENEYEDKLIGKYAGIPPYQKGHEEDFSFGHFNPDLIKWGIDNLYISPDTLIYGVKAQDIYNKSFQRYFRLTTESYLYLTKKKGLYKTEQNKYIGEYNKTIKNETYSFFGPEYLELRYNKLAQFKQYNDDRFTYSPGIAIGFWLRRGLDKTDKVLWSGLKQVMTNYDKEWFKKVSK